MGNDSGQAGYCRGVMSLVILSLLKREDMYGYQLVQEASRSSGGRLTTQEGSGGKTHDPDLLSSGACRRTLNGTYTYDGATSSCTAATCSVAVYDDGWNLDTKYAYRSGDTAYASVTMCHMVLGVMVEKSTCKLTHTCDKNGNFS